tara:strand:- start:462 stop:1235 length:774 start_codon:yes stop_codon:yes gene_type:complete
MLHYLIKLPIFKRLIPSITRRYYKFSKKNKNYYCIGNINFYFDFLDPIDRKIILNKCYEHDQVKFLEKKMKQIKFSNFFDIGANSGYYSFYFADKFKDLKIKSFELNIDANYKFAKTLEKNNFKNIEKFNFGLSDREGQVTIRSMYKDGFVHSNSEVIDNSYNFDGELYKTKSANLKVGDDLFSFKNENLCMKIDVEGHEIHTLKGLVDNLQNNNCLILLESETNFDEVNNFLKNLKYKCIFKSEYRSDYIYTNINI